MADNTAGSLEVPLLALIKRRDPTFFKDRARVTEYEMSNGRVFTADPTTRGAYADTRGPNDLSTPDLGAINDLSNES